MKTMQQANFIKGNTFGYVHKVLSITKELHDHKKVVYTVCGNRFRRTECSVGHKKDLTCERCIEEHGKLRHD